ncbi:MAG: DUF5050 domain-containing protein [Candidatus Delongbacteria bacterium]|nr:DUF5050 domain-containing protein [Candidatus Delongbacteria bacterium]MCG2760235.1 DUF5050 domain-containing protein [Candidatus Delongbacteria bacterium]
MKKVITMIFVTIVFLTGCSTQYRMVKKTEVSSKTTNKGEEIQVKQQTYIAFKEVIERSPNVKAVTRMTDLKGTKQPTFYSVSPSSSEITVQIWEEDKGKWISNLWKLKTSGSTALTRLTNGNYYDDGPCYSGDGSNIYFSSNRSSETLKIFRVKSDGAGGITKLTQSNSYDAYPSISANSQGIYFMSKPYNAEEWQIWSMTYNGQLPTQIKEGEFSRVSPDGKSVLFTSVDKKSNKSKIWTMNVEGTNVTQLTFGKGSNDMFPSWANDNNTITYCSDMSKDSNGKKNFDIWVMSVDGSTPPIQLTTNGSTDLLPQFSDDGKYIYFLTNRGFDWDIWRMEIAD